jgi:hypothetical protein
MTSMSTIVTGPDSVRLDDAGSVRVQLVGGSLEVLPRDEPGVLVEVTALTGQPLEVATDADRISIGYPSIGWDGWVKRLATTDRTDRADVRLHVGGGVAVSAATVSASVTATAIFGDVDVATASAPVRLARSTGGVKIRTAAGTVDLESHHGPVTVTGASGAVRIDGEVPRTTVTSVAGDVTVRHRGAAAVLSLTTVSGALTVQLPSQTHLELEVRGVSSRVSVDGKQQGSGLGVTKLVEAGQGPRVMLTANTVSGNVTVDRSDPTPLSGPDVEDAPPTP